MCVFIVHVGRSVCLFVCLFVCLCLSLSPSTSSPTSGVTITGLERPLTVGKPATITCTTNEPASSIEWRNGSNQLNISSHGNVTELDYTISLVTDDLQGQIFSCTAVVRNVSDTEYVDVSVKGK